MKRFILGITGATGSVYGIRLLEELLQLGYQVYLTITDAGRQVIETELEIPLLEKDPVTCQDKIQSYLTNDRGLTEEIATNVHYIPIKEIGASIASGSFLTHGMAVVPCSMSTLAGIAQGRSQNLLERAADVMLKEGRPLLLSPREMPLNTIHLENMLKLSRMGVMMVPPMPGFYHHPQNIEDMIDFVVGKVLDRLGMNHQLFRRWQG